MAPHERFSCKHCDFNATSGYIVKHITTKHYEKIDKFSLRSGMKGRPVGSSVKENTFLMCLGCDKFWINHTKALNHFKTCPNKEGHANKCKEIHDMLPKEAMDAIEAGDMDTVVKPLQEKLAKAEKQIDRLKKDAKTEEEDKDFENMNTERLMWAINKFVPLHIRQLMANSLNENQSILDDGKCDIGLPDWDMRLRVEDEEVNESFPPNCWEGDSDEE
jgi:hypothetical protein